MARTKQRGGLVWCQGCLLGAVRGGRDAPRAGHQPEVPESGISHLELFANNSAVGYESAMPWRTYTPDGRTLDVEYEDGTWVASCDDGQGVGTTAQGAIAQSLGVAMRPIGQSPQILDEWVVQQAALLEHELDEELDPFED